MRLHELRPAKGATRKRKRLGRGTGSGRGTTSGKGHKGQRARAGGNSHPWFEGGQMPLIRRVPKVGFHNPFRVEYQVINVRDLAQFEPNTEVTPELLRRSRVVRKSKMPIKLLGQGEIDRPLKIQVDAASAAARQKIEGAGGSLELTPVQGQGT
jgi:large subunit ribosomal protein L15